MGQLRRTNHPGDMSGRTPIAPDLKFAADRGGVAANSRTSQLDVAGVAKLLRCGKTKAICTFFGNRSAAGIDGMPSV